MAYDSATAVVEAGNAYKRALAAAQQKRASLESDYGLNDDGSMDNSAAGQLGSLYQGNLGAVNQEIGAESADRKRGFGTNVGLGGKSRSAVHQLALTQQAMRFRDANSALGANTQESQQATQDYRDQVGDDGTGGIIGRNAAWDLAQTLAANPVLGPAAPAPGSALGAAMAPVANPYTANKTPAQVQKVLKKTPSAAWRT